MSGDDALEALRAASARLDAAGDPGGEAADPLAQADLFDAVHAALVAVLADVDGT